MTNHNALIVDDEPDIRELLTMTLNGMGIQTRAAADLGEARRLLASHPFDFCLTDMRLPDGEGLELVREIQHQYPDLPVAVITAFGNLESAVETLKAGAFDYVSKPVDLNNLRNLVHNALELRTHTRSDRRSRHILLGESPAMCQLRGIITKLARSQAPIYIRGESGTGKELVAHLIHDKGPRASRPFIAVNCGAIPGELMESEFFGHRKGSFTGASKDKQGLFQAAEGGTLFLDEVAELPLSMQVKLLRAIQERAVRPVGAQQEMPVDVRLLSATHKDLDQLVQEGAFRQDLYYRINVIQLEVPPLRARRQDLPLLTDNILQHLAKRNRCEPPTLAPEALETLAQYPFPGNVRELENTLERGLSLCESGYITATDLSLPTSVPAPSPTTHHAAELNDYLNDLERQRITQVLEQTHWNRTEAARRLGISFRSLRYRLEKLGIG